MKGLVIAVCCLVAVAVAEEEKMAEMSLAPGSVTGQSTLGGTPLGRQWMGVGGVGGFPGVGGVGGFPGVGGGWGVNQMWGGLPQNWGGVFPGMPGVGSFNPMWNQGLNPVYDQWRVGGMGTWPGAGGWQGNWGNVRQWGGVPGLVPYGGSAFAGQALVGQQPLGGGPGAGVGGGVKQM